MVQSLSLDSNSSPGAPDEFLGFTVVKLAHVLHQRMDAALRIEAGISVRQFGALTYLSREPGIGSAALARRLLITPQSAGPLIDDLVQRGLVDRDDAQSGVRKAARLTPKGQAALSKGFTVAERLRREDNSFLAPDDGRIVNAALLRLLARLTGA